MKIAIGCDHGGYELKEQIMSYLQNNGHEVVNCGCDSLDSVDYPDFAEKVCFDVRSGVCDGGILICGTGIGMSIAANRYRDIRAALCHEAFTARMSREHNNAPSACFPPIFGPIKIKKDGRTIGHLTDGGVYDNTGMEPIWNSNEVVLISDAGTPFDHKVPKWFGSRIMRYVDIGRNQVGALRRRAIIRRLHRGYQTVREDDGPSPCSLAEDDECYMRNRRVTDKPTGAFWRLASRKSNFCENCSTEFEQELAELERDWYGYPEELLQSHIGEIRTDMDAFTKAETKILENHGYFMADLAVRRHARHLGNISTPFRVPHRDVLEPDAVRDALRVSHSRLHFWRRWFD